MTETRGEALRKQKRQLKWRRVLVTSMTMMMVTVVVCVVTLNGVFYLKPSVFPAPHKISGKVMMANKPVGGISLILDGGKVPSVTSDSSGNYSFTDLPSGGSYTVTPKAPMNFEPPSCSFNSLARDEVANFSAVVPRVYEISGRVMAASKPLAGVAVILDGARTATTTTDSNGKYAFSDLQPDVSYTVTPKAKLKFEPAGQSFADLGRDEVADFGIVQLYKIRGRILDATGPVAGVKLMLGGTKTGSTATDAAGNYTFTDLTAGGRYTITPQAQKKANSKFEPASQLVKALTQDAAADFKLVELYTISGRVMGAAGPVAGVKLMLGGTKTGSRSTDEKGNYTFTDLPAGGSYLITPTAPGNAAMNFEPVRWPFKKLAQNEAANFLGIPVKSKLTSPTPTPRK